MHTYIKTADSTEFAAVRASRAELIRVMPELATKVVFATKALRRLAYISAIPTYVIGANKSLQRI